MHSYYLIYAAVSVLSGVTFGLPSGQSASCTLGINSNSTDAVQKVKGYLTGLPENDNWGSGELLACQQLGESPPSSAAICAVLFSGRADSTTETSTAAIQATVAQMNGTGCDAHTVVDPQTGKIPPGSNGLPLLQLTYMVAGCGVNGLCPSANFHQNSTR